ncbi:MAG: hypothetical protein AAGB22_00175, partial [Bacteroidota bacterium]
MDNTDQHLQQLFAAAREDNPNIPYQQVQQRFLAVGSAAALAVWCHYLLKSFTSKLYLMTFSSLAIIGISTAVLVHTN